MMSRTFEHTCLIALLVVLLGLLPVTGVSAQEGQGRINVKVVDDDQEAVDDAEVVVKNAATGEVVAELTTDGNGVVIATGLEFMDYMVAVDDGCRASSPAFTLDADHPDRDLIFVLRC